MDAPTVYYRSDFVPEAEELFGFLAKSVVWDERMKARKTASFGVAYNYSQISYPAVPMPVEIENVCALLEHHIRYWPNNCLLNWYPDGSSSMGFHSDTSEELTPGTGVAIVSLGSSRPIVFRSKAHKTVEYAYTLSNGSLLYMSKEVQDHWLHAIPKVPEARGRISLTFRSILK